MPEGDSTAIRVLIVDDQPLQRMGVRMFLAGQAGIEVVGEAGDGSSAVREARSLLPDVVLMDVRMPGTDGIAATQQIVEGKSDPTTGPWILLLTTFDMDEYVLAGLEAGASGFLTKDADPVELLSAVRAVAAGDAVIAPSATRRLVERMRARAPEQTRHRPTQPPDLGVESLTAREREILVSIGNGLTNAEIAGELYLAESTVKNYVGRIFAKIGARDRVQAVLVAVRAGLIDRH
jgi:DNA-binding NarL/FixJ family response regulator